MALVALAIGYGFNTADRQLLSILAGPIKADLHLSDTQLGLMGGVAFALFYATCGLPLAWIADRWSRANMIAISLGLWSAFTAACGAVQTGGQLFLCRLGVGFGEAGGTAPSFSLVSDYYPPDRRARAIALLNFAAPLGVAMGPLAAALISSALNWRAAFVVAGVLGLMFVPFFRWAVRGPLPQSQDGSAAASVQLTPQQRRAGLRALFRTRSFWFLTIGASLHSMVLQGVLFWLPSFLQRSHGLALVDRAVMFGVITACAGIAGNWTSGWIIDRWSSNRRLHVMLPAAAGLVAIPAYAAGLNVPAIPFAAPLTFVAMILTFAYSTPVYAVVQHLVPPGLRSTGIASYLLINNSIGIGVGVVLLGFLADALNPLFGSEALKYSLFASSGLYVLGAASFWLCSATLERDWIEG